MKVHLNHQELQLLKALLYEHHHLTNIEEYPEHEKSKPYILYNKIDKALEKSTEKIQERIAFQQRQSLGYSEAEKLLH